MSSIYFKLIEINYIDAIITFAYILLSLRVYNVTIEVIKNGKGMIKVQSKSNNKPNTVRNSHISINKISLIHA